MMGDYHVRFCERLAGETPACLLGLVLLWVKEHGTPDKELLKIILEKPKNIENNKLYL